MNSPEPPGRRRRARRREIVRVGLLGCGTVGSEVARVLRERPDRLERAVGGRVQLGRVAVRHARKPRPVALPAGLLTTDAASVVSDPEIDVVVELIGGMDPPYGLLVEAIGLGKSVVTANKELLALTRGELFSAAAEMGIFLGYEGSIGGAVPLVKVFRDSLVADRVRRFEAVLNGTSNFVLDLLATEGCSFSEAVERARELGYAERDPGRDLDGSDAACKAALLARLAFGVEVDPSQVSRRGIEASIVAGIRGAAQRGRVIRVVATAERGPTGIDVRVLPVELPLDHPLAGVRGADNRVVVEAELAGRLTLSGGGAGGTATAGAVLADVAEAARRVLRTGDASAGPMIDVPLLSEEGEVA